MRKCTFLALISTLALPYFAFAFRLTPMVIHFAPGGGKITQVLTLENPGSDKIPVQLEAFLRTTDAKGEEVRTKTDEFVIYPEQLVLLANEKRNVRVTWEGEVKAGAEKAYRIIASQLPVEFQEKNSVPTTAGVNLKFLLQYVASAYVTPPGAVAKIKVKDVKKRDNKRISITLVNEGSAHQVLRPKVIKIFSGDKFLQSISNFEDLQNVNLLAKNEKTFSFTLSHEVKESSLRAEVEFSEAAD